MASEANAHKGLSEVVNDKSQKSKLNRACEACHALKIRCTIENASSSSKNCQRCTGLGQKCTFAAPRKRKPRLRPDIKIAELEKEVRAMRSFFNREKTNRNSSNVENKSPIDPSVRSQGSDGLLDYRSASNRFQLDGLSGPIYPSSIAQEPQYQVSATDPTLTSSESQSDLSQGLAVAINPTKPDVIDRGLLSMDTAEKYLQSYIVDMVPHYPALVFPEGYTAEELRNTRPVLFLAVMAAVAARSPDSAVASALSTELIREFAVEIFINSQKSLELVQALLITVLWYNPPRGQLKFYEYIHMAASMAVDLGIGVDISQSSISSGPDQGRDALRPSQARTSCYEPPSVYTKTNDNDVEGCRTLIACYLGCSGVALSMRRPNMLRYNRNISDSINFLTTCSRAVPSDERLIAWAKLLIITEEIGISFSLDDLGRVVSLAESRAQLMLKSFEKQLAGWYNETHSSVMNGIVRLFIRNTGPALKLLAGSLRMMYHNANIYLHEIALHADHCPEDFKLPLGRASKASIHKKISPPYIDAITICISSAHSLLDAFLAIDLESSQALPVFNHVRVSYAVFVLTKLYISASDPKSDLCSVLDRGNLRVDSYTDLVIARLESIAKRTSYVFPKMFVGPLYRLREWIAELETAPQWQDQMQRIGEPLHFRAGRKEHEPSNHKEDGNGSLESPKSDSVVGTVSMSSFEWDLPEMNPHSIPDCWRSDPNAQNFSLSSSDQHMDVDPATEPSDSAILIDTIRQPEFGHDSNTFNGFQMDLDSEIFSMFDAMGGIRGDTIDWSSVPSIEFQSTGMELPWTLDSSAQDNSPLNP